MSLIEELVARNNLLTERNLGVLNGLQALLAERPPEIIHDSGADSYAVDLRTEHSDLLITVSRPCYYIQAWCDGLTEGISIRIGDQNNQSLDLNRFIIIPVFNPDKIFFSNDVRSGRTSVVLYFVRTPSPLTPYIGGEAISRAEQAGRLGSIVTYDRRGEVVWFDDFEEGLNHWDSDLSGVGASAALSVATAMRGTTSVKLVAGSTVNHYAGLTRAIALPKFVSSLGVETAWSIADANVEEAQFLLDAYARHLSHTLGVRYVVATGQTAVLTGAATWTNVDTGVLYPPFVDAKHFIQFKFVVELSNMAYRRFLVGPLDIAVTPYTGYATVDPVTKAHLQLTGKNIGVAAVNGVAYADNFIITQNEPTI